jgi:hypothetical protein
MSAPVKRSWLVNVVHVKTGSRPTQYPLGIIFDDNAEFPRQGYSKAGVNRIREPLELPDSI